MPTMTGHSTAIRAKKVIGTDVKNTTGEKIGKIEDVVLDKQSNNILFAAIGFDGFMGMGEKYHPVPWNLLDYDDKQDSYVVPFTKEQLKAAPCDTLEELTKNDGRSYREQSYKYYEMNA